MAIYLDYAASSPLRPEAMTAMLRTLERIGNPASIHGFGRSVRADLEGARKAVAGLLQAKPSQVLWTSGGTEAIATAMAGLGTPGGLWLVSAIEHPCILAGGHAMETIPVDTQGVLSLDALKTRLHQLPYPTGIAVMYANHETGVRQPVAEVAALARDAGCVTLCDAVQGAGKTPLCLAELGVDAVAISAHKLGGPQGAGALILATPEHLIPLMPGGGQERGKRGGTPNSPGIAGFGAAAQAFLEKHTQETHHIQALQRYLEDALTTTFPQVQVWGAQADRLPGTLSLCLPGVDRHHQVLRLDLDGIAISAGSACSSGKTVPSHVLIAMGVSPTQAAESIRISFGWNSTLNDIEAFLHAWKKLV